MLKLSLTLQDNTGNKFTITLLFFDHNGVYDTSIMNDQLQTMIKLTDHNFEEHQRQVKAYVDNLGKVISSNRISNDTVTEQYLDFVNGL